MERRLIDANALAKWLDKEHHVDKPTGKCDERQNRVLGIAVSALKNPQIAPTIDAVEVVRCRECKQFWEYSEEHKATVENADGDCAIRKWRSDDEQFCAVTKDDYCSLGERREPDENTP